MKSSGEHRAGSRGPLVSDINTRAALESLHAGIANTHLNILLSTMNMPTMNQSIFKRREREIGKIVENVARERCQLNLNLEKAMAQQSSSSADSDELVGIALFHTIWDGKKGEGGKTLHSRLYNLKDRFKGSNCSILSQ